MIKSVLQKAFVVAALAASGNALAAEIDSPSFTFVSEAGSRTMLTVEGLPAGEKPELAGGTVLSWNGSTLGVSMKSGEPVTVYGNITGIEYMFGVVISADVTRLPELNTLTMGVNELTVLDLSGNSKLKTINVDSNYLTTLDFSACVDVEYINCSGNSISGDGMTSMMESLPARTLEKPGVLVVLNPDDALENNLCLKSDVAIAASKYWGVYKASGYNADGTLKLVDYSGEDAGVDNVSVDCFESAEFYDLRGVRVEHPRSGVYVRRCGSEVTKVLVK